MAGGTGCFQWHRYGMINLYNGDGPRRADDHFASSVSRRDTAEKNSRDTNAMKKRKKRAKKGEMLLLTTRNKRQKGRSKKEPKNLSGGNGTCRP